MYLFMFRFLLSSHAQLHQTPSLSNKSHSTFHNALTYNIASSYILRSTLPSLTHEHSQFPIVLKEHLCIPSLHTEEMSPPWKP